MGNNIKIKTDMRVVQWLLVALVIAAQATETSFVTD